LKRDVRGRHAQCVGDQPQQRLVGRSFGRRGTHPDPQFAGRPDTIDAVGAAARREANREADGFAQANSTMRASSPSAISRISGEKSIPPVCGSSLRMGASIGSVVS